MIDKVRLHAAGALPADYGDNLGEGKPHFFDARCCRFLGVRYEDVRARVLKGGCDEEVLGWAEAAGTRRSDEECLIWNRFMTKIGWRDDRSPVLRDRAAEFGIAPGTIETFCELQDVDEGRAPGATRSWEGQPIHAVVVMGVSGSGKTTVGRGLASELGWDFLEADDLHPPANIRKLSEGVALTEADRAPWIAAVRAGIESSLSAGRRVVASCSALKAAHRLVLAPDPGNTRFVHLRGDFALIKRRLEERTGHFMKETLLRSQFADLEEPLDALALDVGPGPSAIAGRIREVLGLP
jgi:gluconokinase